VTIETALAQKRRDLPIEIRPGRQDASGGHRQHSDRHGGFHDRMSFTTVPCISLR
jgi:hypothetical protein